MKSLSLELIMMLPILSRSLWLLTKHAEGVPGSHRCLFGHVLVLSLTGRLILRALLYI